MALATRTIPQVSFARRRTIRSNHMLAEEIIIGVGLVMVVLIMALIMNPPEALVKKFYHRNAKRASKNNEPGK